MLLIYLEKMSSTNSTTTNSRRALKLNDWIELLSNAAVPLMIGVISLWIALHQQNIAQKHREQDTEHANQLRQQDLQLARLQRDEDKEIACLQRIEDQDTIRLQREEDHETAQRQRDEDRKIAQLQREEDRKMAQLQRDEDREIAQLQRELDLNITYVKRMQDYELAEKERNLSEIQRTNEFEINYHNRIQDLLHEDNRQKESVLMEYQDDLAVLLLEYNLIKQNPSSDPWFILQMKTEAALRQLDSVRRTILVRSLYEAEIFNIFVEPERSVFYKVNLTGVQFGESVHIDAEFDGDWCTHYNHLTIIESDIRYATFHDVCLASNCSFEYSNLDYTDWSYVIVWNRIYVRDVSMNYAKFLGSYLVGTKFDKTVQMKQVSFQYNRDCIHCHFDKAKLEGARLDHSNFIQSYFFSLSLIGGNMTYGSFRETTFDAVQLDGVSLAGADLSVCRFSAVSMINCLLFETNLHKVIFHYVNMTGCQGVTDQQLSQVTQFYQTTLPNGTFIENQINRN